MTPRPPFHWSNRQPSMTWRQTFALLAVAIVLLALIVAMAFIGSLSKANAQGAACFRHGVPAVCRSPAVEQQAKAIVLRQCRRCDRGKVADAIYSFQMNRGPYESAAELARDVLQQVTGP